MRHNLVSHVMERLRDSCILWLEGGVRVVRSQYQHLRFIQLAYFLVY